jgi:hypothetical protein
MSQQKKQSAWYRFFHPSNRDSSSSPSLQSLNTLSEVKIITENDLKIESILLEEFRFRGDFLKQVSNDATSTFNLYFLFLGISISGISVLYNLVDKTISSLQILTIFLAFVFGIGNTLFFVRFISIIHVYERHKAVMNVIREYYIKYLQSQIPDVRNVFRIPLEYSVPIVYALLLFSYFAILDSLCFAGAIFVLTEFWLRIKFQTFLLFPTDLRPYFNALLVFILALVSHILFYNLILFKNIKKMQSMK